MKLRTLAFTSTGWLTALSLLTAGSLALSTTYIDREVEHLWQTVEDVRRIEEMEVSLLTHERESALLALNRSESHERARKQAKQELQTWMAALRSSEGAASDAELMDAVEREIRLYFAVRQRADKMGERPLGAYADVSEAVDRAYTALEVLLTSKLEQARVARARATRWNDVSDSLSIAAVTSLLFGLVVVLWQVRRQLYRPLLAIRAAIDRYGAGEREARAPACSLDELREIAVAFNDVAAALEEQRRRQLGVLASVAHDLRNPLAALKLTVDQVRPDRPLPPEERLRPMLARIGQQVARCNRMLSDLMDLARLDSGELELRYEERDARDLTREVVELYRPAATAHEIALSIPDEPVPLRCDPLRLEQVLCNLLANAIKYSPGGGAVRVEVSLAGGEVAIAVSDNGVGIALEDQGRLFERYARAASSRDVAPGAGLGLWAARRIVQAHGGRVDLRSESGAGATFTVRLPVAGAVGSGQ
jgi:signal transduction histidine kinase